MGSSDKSHELWGSTHCGELWNSPGTVSFSRTLIHGVSSKEYLWGIVEPGRKQTGYCW